MAQKIAPSVDDVFILAKTVLLDLPFAGARWGCGVGAEKTVTETAWQGYDAGVRLAAAAVDNLYRMPLYGAVLNRTVSVLLRWQQVTNAVSGAMFASLWRSVGLPTTEETRALHEELSHLKSNLQAQRQENDALIGLATRIVQALEAEAPESTISSGLNGHAIDKHPLTPASSFHISTESSPAVRRETATAL